MQVLIDWTKCDAAGIERCITAIHSMRPERSTNLMAGINSGFGQFKKFLDVAGSDNLDKYALSLVITTDGMPSAQWHPARGASGYAPLVKNLRKDLSKLHPAAPPTVTTIGIGFQLVSKRRRERRRGCPHPLLRCTLPFPSPCSSSLHPHPLTPPPSHPTPPSFHPFSLPPPSLATLSHRARLLT